MLVPEFQNDKPLSKTAEYFKKLCRIIYFIGGQDIWCGDLKIPKAIKLFHLFHTNVVSLASVCLILLQWAVFFTNQNLTEKQIFDSKIFAVVHLISFGSVIYTEIRRKEIADLMKRLIDIKDIYNDENTEQHMISTCRVNLKYFSILVTMSCILYGVDGYIQVLKGHTFVTMVTAWPDVDDLSLTASIGRVVVYFVWLGLVFRMTTIFITAIPLTIFLSNQFKVLSCYFKELNDIFDENFSQEEKEAMFEKKFKVGIKLHSETLGCTDQLQILFNAVYGGQIIVKSTCLISLMASIVTAERSFSHMLTTLVTVAYALLSLACLVLNAGNISVEAARLPLAISKSGWQHCSGKSNARIRHLVVFAVRMSQRPVILKCLGFVTLSFETYVTIVKSCYSAFSVLY